MISPIPIKNLKDIENVFGPYLKNGKYIFRGLSSKHQSIKPSLYYKRDLRTKEALEIEVRLTRNFARILETDFEISEDNFNTQIDLWLIGRHFGLASHFVEFTRDFSCALQFSFEYARKENTCAYLWALNTTSNQSLRWLDRDEIKLLDPFLINQYLVMSPSLRLSEKDETKLAFDRMFIQNSAFLLQPIEWAPTPVTDKLDSNSWILMEITPDNFEKISKDVQAKYNISMTRPLLMKPHALDKSCGELNDAQNV